MKDLFAAPTTSCINWSTRRWIMIVATLLNMVLVIAALFITVLGMVIASESTFSQHLVKFMFKDALIGSDGKLLTSHFSVQTHPLTGYMIVFGSTNYSLHVWLLHYLPEENST